MMQWTYTFERHDGVIGDTMNVKRISVETIPYSWDDSIKTVKQADERAISYGKRICADMISRESDTPGRHAEIIWYRPWPEVPNPSETTLNKDYFCDKYVEDRTFRQELEKLWGKYLNNNEPRNDQLNYLFGQVQNILSSRVQDYEKHVLGLDLARDSHLKNKGK